MTEQRTHPRFPLSLDVAVTVEGRDTFFCTARDFCIGGMYLVFNTQFAIDTPAPSQLVADAKLEIDFSDPTAPESGAMRLHGKIARIEADDIGFGVAFTSQNIPALQVLKKLTDLGSTPSEELPAEKDIQPFMGLIDHVRSDIHSFSEKLFTDTINQADEGLINLAKRARNNDEQNHCYMIKNSLERTRPQMTADFRDGLLDTTRLFTEYEEVEEIPPELKGKEKVKLSLIDKEEFDDWLILTTLISRLEGLFSEELYALECRLSYIGLTPINKQNNPVGPYIVGHMFKDVIHRHSLTQTQGEMIYKIFGELLKERLVDLYSRLNDRLIQAGIIPDISDEYVFIGPAGSSYGQTGSEQSPIPPADLDENGVPIGTVNVPPDGNGDLPSGTVADTYTTSRQKTAQPGIHVPMQIPGHGFTALSSLMSYSRHARTSKQGEQQLPDTPADTRQIVYYPSDQLVDALEQLASQVGNLGEFREQGKSVLNSLSDHLEKSSKKEDGEYNWAINDQQEESIQFVENLLDYFQADLLISDISKEWIARLEIPLLKACILDPDILHNNEHAAHQVINQIDTIGNSLARETEERRHEIVGQVEALIAWIVQEVDDNPNVFQQALITLEEAQNSQQVIYDRNVAAVLKECENQNRLNNARADLVEELNLRIGDRDVARIVIALLDIGWKNLLLKTYVQKGADDEVYQHHINVLDQLNARLTGQAPFNDDPKLSDADLFSWITQILSKVVKDKERGVQLLNTLKYLLKTDAKEVQKVHVPRLSADLFQARKKSEKSKPSDISNTEWYKWLDHADALNRDDLVTYIDDKNEKQILKLIWLNKAFSQYVFIDNMGYKILDVDLDQLANMLYTQTLVKVDEWDTPIMERATFSLLDKLHQQFSEQSNKDELTGLLNRRAFERHISMLLDKRGEDDVDHIFSYFDIDRFNLINNTCGYESGDTLLLQFATILKDGYGDEAVIARLGDDEYGVMAEGVGRSKGLAMTNNILDTLHTFSFSCDENDFAITTSIGMVEFDEMFTTTSDLMRAAESACFSAKEAGRDNIQIYNPENVHLAQRQSQMSWVGRINKLFDAGLIKLNCQKIAPLKEHIHTRPHYEILLEVYDEDGNKVPTEEFIIAAEQYNRINDIDHWVVNAVLDWIETNHHLIKNKLSGFSINLSGSSLNDKKFMDKLHERMIDITFPAEMVTFEITETLAIKNIDNAARFMHNLKETGCGFSLDDFGSGVSSYSYLKSLPVDYLKIDGIFVRELATSTNDYAVIKSINEISHVMGKATIAEYAEDEIIVQVLRDIGIDYAQGFGVEKPRPLDSLIGK